MPVLGFEAGQSGSRAWAAISAVFCSISSKYVICEPPEGTGQGNQRLSREELWALPEATRPWRSSLRGGFLTTKPLSTGLFSVERFQAQAVSR